MDSEILLVVSRAVFSGIRTGQCFLASSIYTILFLCTSHIIKFSLTDCLVNVGKYSDLRSSYGPHFGPHLKRCDPNILAFTKQSVNK